MRNTWQLPTQAAVPASRKLAEVLLWYEGPEIVTLRDDHDTLFLGITADEGEGRIRWLQAHTTEHEIDALKCGDITLFNAIRKRDMLVVDQTKLGVPIEAWTATAETLDPADLPAPDALLPDERTPPATPQELVFDGAAIHTDGLDVDALTDATSHFRAVLTALQRAPHGRTRDRGSMEVTAFRISEMRRGSLIMPIVPVYEELFADLADEFSRLVASGGASAASDQVRNRFRDLVLGLERANLNLYPRWQSGAAFISADMAYLMHRDWKSSVPTKQAPKMEATPMTGTFQQYHRRGVEFAFEADGGGVFHGKVAPELVAMKPVVTPHESRRYRVTILSPAGQEAASGCTLLTVQEDNEPPPPSLETRQRELDLA